MNLLRAYLYDKLNSMGAAIALVRVHHPGYYRKGPAAASSDSYRMDRLWPGLSFCRLQLLFDVGYPGEWACERPGTLYVGSIGRLSIKLWPVFRSPGSNHAHDHHRRWLPYSYLLSGLHGRRPGFLAFLRLPQLLYFCHGAAGGGR